MPSVLSDADKETVKRFVPKANNKIQAVAVAKLYVAFPNRQKWTETGLQGAAVLCNDLVGNTFWIKMVDISVRSPSTPPIPSSFAPLLLTRPVRKPWRNLGPGNLRLVELQPGPCLLPHV